MGSVAFNLAFSSLSFSFSLRSRLSSAAWARSKVNTQLKLRFYSMHVHYRQNAYITASRRASRCLDLLFELSIFFTKLRATEQRSYIGYRHDKHSSATSVCEHG